MQEIQEHVSRQNKRLFNKGQDYKQRKRDYKESKATTYPKVTRKLGYKDSEEKTNAE